MKAVILHNIRSTYNVGSILRTCDGLGVDRVICSGYTPYPQLSDDVRLPHIAEKLTREIHKTALGAESTIDIIASDDIVKTIKELKKLGVRIIGLEQAPESVLIGEYLAPTSFALILGEEVNGIDPSILQLCEDVLEIPMKGAKESFNVSVATGIALYQLTRG